MKTVLISLIDLGLDEDKCSDFGIDVIVVDGRECAYLKIDTDSGNVWL